MHTKSTIANLYGSPRTEIIKGNSLAHELVNFFLYLVAPIFASWAEAHQEFDFYIESHCHCHPILRLETESNLNYGWYTKLTNHRPFWIHVQVSQGSKVHSFNIIHLNFKPKVRSSTIWWYYTRTPRSASIASSIIILKTAARCCRGTARVSPTVGHRQVVVRKQWDIVRSWEVVRNHVSHDGIVRVERAACVPSFDTSFSLISVLE